MNHRTHLAIALLVGIGVGVMFTAYRMIHHVSLFEFGRMKAEAGALDGVVEITGDVDVKDPDNWPGGKP